MSGAQVGLGTITFGIIFVGVFDAETGFTVANATVPAVNVQSDTDTNIVYCAGTSKDFGSVTASVQVADNVNVNSLVGTEEVLTVTYPSGDTETANAALLSAPRTTGVNAKNLIACTFQWTADPVFA